MLDLSNNSISLAGEFAVLAQLALHGYDANMTLGNTKSVDILVADPISKRMFKIEVKTHYRKTTSKSKLFGHTLDWIMTDKHETIIDSDLYYVFVNISQGQHFRFFIVPSNIVAKYVKDSHQYWLTTKTPESDSELRRFRLGLDDGSYPVDTPLLKNHESRWDFFKQ